MLYRNVIVKVLVILYVNKPILLALIYNFTHALNLTTATPLTHLALNMCLFFFHFLGGFVVLLVNLNIFENGKDFNSNIT